MATQSGQKILRVGVIQNDRVIEERIFRARETVTIGQKYNNTLVVPIAEAPDSFKLFDVRGGKYHLCFTDGMSGRVSTGQATLSLADLKGSGKASVSGGVASVELPETSRGKVSVADVTFLFQFVNPPPLRVLPQLPANMRGGFLQFLASIMGLSGAFLAALLFSFALQFGLVLYLVLLVPPPPRPRSIEEMSSRFVRALEPPEEPPELPDEEPELVEEDGEPVDVSPDPEPVAEVREPEPTAEPSEPRTREERREEAQRLVDAGPIATLFTSDSGGVDTGWEAVDRTGRQSAEELLAQRGPTEAGLRSTLPGGRAGAPTGGARTTGDVDVPGQPGAPQVGTPGREEGPRLVGAVRSEDLRTVGQGRLDDNEIRRAMRRNQARIRACYQRALNENPTLQGRLVLRFEIGRDGRVAQVRIPTNTLGDQVGRCVEGEARRWRFAQPEGGTVWVENPFVFSPGGR